MELAPMHGPAGFGGDPELIVLLLEEQWIDRMYAEGRQADIPTHYRRQEEARLSRLYANEPDILAAKLTRVRYRYA